MARDITRISYRSRAQKLIGSLLIAAGGVGLLVAVGGPRALGIENPDADTPVRIVGAIGILVLGLPGLLVTFLDREVVVDRKQAVLALGWRWLGWKRMTVYPVEADARIEVDVKTVSVGRQTETFYPVRYDYSGGCPEIVNVSDYGLSRRRAETLARAMHIPLVDTTGGTRVVRAVADLDRSVADPAALPEGIAWRRLPQGTRMQARLDAGRLDVRIPPPGFDGAAALGVGMMGVAGYLAWQFVAVTMPQLSGVGGAVSAVVLGAVMAFLGLAGWFIFAERVLTTTHLEASQEGLRLRHRTQAKGEMEPAGAIEELSVERDGGGVIARTDQRDLTLAYALSRAEAEWLRDAVHLALAGRRPPPRPPA